MVGTAAQVAGGVLAGVLWAALGWYRVHQKNPLEPFDPKNFFITLATGAGIGLFFPEALGEPADFAQTPALDFTFSLAATIGPVALIDKLISIFFKSSATSTASTTTTSPTAYVKQSLRIPGLRNLLNWRF